MAIKIKTPAEIARKWAEVTPPRSKQWEAEIQATPDSDWADPAIAAAPNWEAGTQAAAAADLYPRGIEEARTKWKRKSLALGASRFGPGVRAAEADHAAGYAPYRDVIAGLTLTPRGPRGDPGNYDRVRQIGEALHDRRIAG